MTSKTKRSKFVISQIKKETSNIVTFFLSPLERKIIFKAGQYVAVYLDRDKPVRAKFYTISNPPSDKFVAISVKKIGVFSSALHKLKIGDNLYLSGPFGQLYPRNNMNNLVFLASGIGIAPFVSIVKNYNNRKIKKHIDIFYSCRTMNNMAFYKDLNDIANKNNFLKIHYFLTGEKRKNKIISNYERINIKYIRKELGVLANKNFYICGSEGFVGDMVKQLRRHKVKESNIFTELFF